MSNPDDKTPEIPDCISGTAQTLDNYQLACLYEATHTEIVTRHCHAILDRPKMRLASFEDNELEELESIISAEIRRRAARKVKNVLYPVTSRLRKFWKWVTLES